MDNKLKEYSFSYLVLKIIQYYKRERYYTSIEKFNESNDFGRNKIMLFPYFVCKYSDNQKIVFKIFDNFVPDSIGIIDSDIQKELENGQIDGNITVGPFSLRIGPETKEIDVLLSEARRKLNETRPAITPSDEIDSAFKNLINKKEDLPFLSFDELSFQSKQNSPWKLYEKIFKRVQDDKEKEALRKEFNYSVSVEVPYYSNKSKELIFA